MDRMIQLLNKKLVLTDEEEDFLRSELLLQEVPAKVNLLEQGAVSKHFYFLEKGCVRMFYNVEGEEKTAFFYQEDQFVSSYESFVKQIPSKHYLQTIEPSTLVSISNENAGELIEKFPKFAVIAQIVMEEELSIMQDVLASFIAMTPKQRYDKFVTEQFELSQRIPQYQLATYLGVRPETLSRLRRK